MYQLRALLMNVFCYPGVFRDGRVGSILDVTPGHTPILDVERAFHSQMGNSDRTEVDMRLGHLLIEAN